MGDSDEIVMRLRMWAHVQPSPCMGVFKVEGEVNFWHCWNCDEEMWASKEGECWNCGTKCFSPKPNEDDEIFRGTEEPVPGTSDREGCEGQGRGPEDDYQDRSQVIRQESGNHEIDSPGHWSPYWRG